MCVFIVICISCSVGRFIVVVICCIWWFCFLCRVIVSYVLGIVLWNCIGGVWGYSDGGGFRCFMLVGKVGLLLSCMFVCSVCSCVLVVVFLICI